MKIPSAPVHRPKFTEAFPRDPALDRLVDAFARGNHRLVRDEAESVAARADDPEVAAAARALRSRLSPDPIAYVLLATSAALLAVLFAWALHESRRYDGARPAAATSSAHVPSGSIQRPQ